MIEKEKSKPGDALMAVLHFTPADLDANRAGRLSRGQINWFGQPVNIWRPEIIGLLMLPVFILASMLCGVLVGFVSPLVLLITVGAFVVIGQWIRETFNADGNPLQKDLQDGKVKQIEGIIRLDVEELHGMPRYRLNIDRLTFVIDQKTFLAFKNNEPYTIYYLPQTQRLVSAEWLR